MIVVYHPPDPFQPVPTSSDSGTALSLALPAGYRRLRVGFLSGVCAGAKEVQCIKRGSDEQILPYFSKYQC